MGNLMMRLILIACLCMIYAKAESSVVKTWHEETVQHLWKEYGNIFRHGNRNAASHLWSAFLMEHAATMTPERFVKLSGGYCAVSGSPVTPQEGTRYRMRLQNVTGGTEIGFTYYCCWPCVCDTQDFIKIDTKTITTSAGPRQYRFMVIGNPCLKKDKIPYEAPEVRCDGERLIEAPMSDHGYVIIAMFFDDDGSRANEESIFKQHCEERARMGYNSGMGEIFRQVAGISPIVPANAPMQIDHTQSTATDAPIGVQGPM